MWQLHIFVWAGRVLFPSISALSSVRPVTQDVGPDIADREQQQAMRSTPDAADNPRLPVGGSRLWRTATEN